VQTVFEIGAKYLASRLYWSSVSQRVGGHRRERAEGMNCADTCVSCRFFSKEDNLRVKGGGWPRCTPVQIGQRELRSILGRSCFFRDPKRILASAGTPIREKRRCDSPFPHRQLVSVVREKVDRTCLLLQRTDVPVFRSEVENADSLLHLPIRLLLHVGAPAFSLKKSQHPGFAVSTRLHPRPEGRGLQAKCR
jgi:hypothetical protein